MALSHVFWKLGLISFWGAHGRGVRHVDAGTSSSRYTSHCRVDSKVRHLMPGLSSHRQILPCSDPSAGTSGHELSWLDRHKPKPKTPDESAGSHPAHNHCCQLGRSNMVGSRLKTAATITIARAEIHHGDEHARRD